MFEHSLIELDKRPRTSRRWLSFPVAVFVHLVAFVGFSFASYWSVGDVKEPDLINPFVISVQLPESKPTQGAQKPQPKPSAPAAAPTRPVVAQPSLVIPDHIPDISTLPSAPSLDPGPVTPSPNPCPDCTGTDPNADPQSRGNDGPDEVGDGRPVVLSAGMKPPVVISRVDPRYTEMARRVGLQGVVIVEAVIDEHGRVDNVKVLRGLPLGLEEAAVAAVRQWRFQPATTLDGRPVKVFYNLTINFRVLH